MPKHMSPELQMALSRFSSFSHDLSLIFSFLKSSPLLDVSPPLDMNQTALPRAHHKKPTVRSTAWRGAKEAAAASAAAGLAPTSVSLQPGRREVLRCLLIRAGAHGSETGSAEFIDDETSYHSNNLGDPREGMVGTDDGSSDCESPYGTDYDWDAHHARLTQYVMDLADQGRTYDEAHICNCHQCLSVGAVVVPVPDESRSGDSEDINHPSADGSDESDKADYTTHYNGCGHSHGSYVDHPASNHSQGDRSENRSDSENHPHASDHSNKSLSDYLAEVAAATFGVSDEQTNLDQNESEANPDYPSKASYGFCDEGSHRDQSHHSLAPDNQNDNDSAVSESPEFFREVLVDSDGNELPDEEGPFCRESCSNEREFENEHYVRRSISESHRGYNIPPHFDCSCNPQSDIDDSDDEYD